MTMTIFEVIGAIAAAIAIIEKWDFIKNTWNKFKTLFTVYVLWSKEDRLRAMEIRKKHQLPHDLWVKDESKIIYANSFRRRPR